MVLTAKNAKIYAEGAKEFFFAFFALFLGVLVCLYSEKILFLVVTEDKRNESSVCV
jgi:hypothetical protein